MTYQIHVQFRGLEPLGDPEYTVPGVLPESASVIVQRPLEEALRHYTRCIQLQLDDRVVTIEPERSAVRRAEPAKTAAPGPNQRPE